ncbi:hypothetical protein L1987_76223 [Smallanthus sonchifolius]|uniref:Uncharacterized protein n=1 Tax=Smallanthus sonchifolius TaxID=185202 RepID=A0ACB9A7Y1_9ASTR|nr:hypothetical protein L1987_76223 [Smallanthus sonchifolius]
MMGVGGGFTTDLNKDPTQVCKEDSKGVTRRNYAKNTDWVFHVFSVNNRNLLAGISTLHIACLAFVSDP